MVMRDYQAAAIRETKRFLASGKGYAPIIVMPTGAGKGPCLSQIAMQAVEKGNRVLILTHRKELLKQNRDKLTAIDSALYAKSCFFSAGIGQKRLDRPIVFAGVQSLCRYANLLPAFDVVIIDEAHRVPPLDREGQYKTCITAIRNAARRKPVWIGLTATPYRTGEGYLWDHPHSLWDGCAYEVDMLSLVQRGFLAPLVTVAPDDQIDVSKLKRNAGEFTKASLEAQTLPLVDTIARGAWQQFQNEGRKGMMVFTANLRLVEGDASRPGSRWLPPGGDCHRRGRRPHSGPRPRLGGLPGAQGVHHHLVRRPDRGLRCPARRHDRRGPRDGLARAVGSDLRPGDAHRPPEDGLRRPRPRKQCGTPGAGQRRGAHHLGEWKTEGEEEGGRRRRRRGGEGPPGEVDDGPLAQPDAGRNDPGQAGTRSRWTGRT